MLAERERHGIGATIALAALLVASYALVAASGEVDAIVYRYGLIPRYVASGRRLHTLLTSMFLHANILHLAANVVMLLIAGGAVERKAGGAKLAVIFFSSGALGGYAYAVMHPTSTMPAIGASGGVYGLVAAMMLIDPFALTIVGFIPLPAFLGGLVLAGMEVYFIKAGAARYIAHTAHLAGMAVGGLMAIVLEPKEAVKGLLVLAATLLVIYYVWKLLL
ncbi:MAG: hypothetical protein DRN99_02025 [Thermoproteota archaeon]|nr:MAG: hypothetical protein DRN99_02025 [Candidatus Korarchaeota archaeon]